MERGVTGVADVVLLLDGIGGVAIDVEDAESATTGVEGKVDC
jgi:hypothetical protein